jgi:hypothetical protein
LAFARPESPEEAELNNRKRSLWDIAAELELLGHAAPGGKCYTATAVSRMIAADGGGAVGLISLLRGFPALAARSKTLSAISAPVPPISLQPAGTS